jgi:hypothetical protein
MTAKIATLCDNFSQESVNSALWSTPAGGSLGVTGATSVSTVFSPATPLCFSYLQTAYVPALSCTGVTNSTVGVVSNLSYDLTDSGISVQLLSWNPSGSGDAQFLVGTSDAEWVGFQMNGTPEVNAIDSNDNGTVLAYDPSEVAFLRIRESSGTVYCDYSADGITWTNMFNESDPFSLANVNVYLNIQVNAGDSPGSKIEWANLYGQP